MNSTKSETFAGIGPRWHDEALGIEPATGTGLEPASGKDIIKLKLAAAHEGRQLLDTSLPVFYCGRLMDAGVVIYVSGNAPAAADDVRNSARGGDHGEAAILRVI